MKPNNCPNLCDAARQNTAIRTSILILAATLFGATAGQASIITFTGQDNGASVTGPFTNSAAIQSAFEATATPGVLNTITYESLALGHSSPIIAAPDVSIALTGTDFGAGIAGISDITNGNVYGFDTTAGGDQWLGFPGGSATFTFSSPTYSFGTFFTGLENSITAPGLVTITFNDGTAESFNVPINSGGGAAYFGFTDTNPFTSLTIKDASANGDAWGIDDTTYSSTPEPATWLLAGAGIAGMLIGRRRMAR